VGVKTLRVSHEMGREWQGEAAQGEQKNNVKRKQENTTRKPHT